MEHVELEVGGMTCDGCVRAVEKRLRSVAGVTGVRVDLEKNEAGVEYGGGATPEQMVAAVEKIGYSARVK
jgi:P-type Cu+ transporter